MAQRSLAFEVNKGTLEPAMWKASGTMQPGMRDN